MTRMSKCFRTDLTWLGGSICGSIFELLNAPVQNRVCEPSLFLNKISQVKCNIIREDTLKDVMAKTWGQTRQTNIKELNTELYSLNI